MLPLLLLMCWITSTCSCAGRVEYRAVLIPETVQTASGLRSNVVRLAEPVEARVYVWDPSGSWVESANRVTLPEGWLAGPPPPAKEQGP